MINDHNTGLESVDRRTDTKLVRIDAVRQHRAVGDRRIPGDRDRTGAFRAVIHIIDPLAKIVTDG